MSDSTRSTTVRYETSAQEQTSVVRTRTICTLKGARSDLPKQGIFLTVWSETVLQKVPHFDRSLPVEGSGLLLRCFLLPVWQVIGRVSMDPLPRSCWSRWCRLLVLCGFLGPGSGCRNGASRGVRDPPCFRRPAACRALGGRRRCRPPWRAPWRSLCTSPPGRWSWWTSPRSSGCP